MHYRAKWFLKCNSWRIDHDNQRLGGFLFALFFKYLNQYLSIYICVQAKQKGYINQMLCFVTAAILTVAVVLICRD